MAKLLKNYLPSGEVVFVSWLTVAANVLCVEGFA
jgi:hypothetical protein